MYKRAASRCLPFFAVLLVAIVSLAGGFRATANSSYYQVFWDGEPVGWVEEEDVVHEALQSLSRSKARAEGVEVAITNEVFIEEALLNSVPDTLMTRADLEKAFRPTANYMAVAYAINIDGRPSVVLRNRESAEETLALVEEYFRQMIAERDNVTLESLEILEDVRIEQISFSPEQIVGVDEAKMILMRGTDVIKIHTVSRGESLWSIASANNISVEDLQAANPEMKSELLQIDQELSLIVPEPYLTVTSTETFVYSQSIPFPTRTENDPDLWPWVRTVKVAGQAGSREVTVRILRENGVEVEREVLNTEVTREPTTQVVVQGTKVVPDRGTGSLAWPVDTGQVTSFFGWRRGSFHQGVDIAAPVGTIIRAADGGTVIHSGPRGAYGLTVMIDHGGGRMVTLYAHNSVNLVSVGAVVEKGQPIARVGSSGRSTGPHVHFEVRIDGTPVNPLNFYQ